MTEIVDITTGLVSTLNGLSLSQSFTATRIAAFPSVNLEDLSSLEVMVWPTSESTELESRSSNQYDYMVNIGIRKRVDPDSVSDINGMLQLLEEIKDGIQFATQNGATWIRTDNSPLFDPDTLLERREFLSSIEVNYRKMR